MTDQSSALTIKPIADEWYPSKSGVTMYAAPDGRIEARSGEPAWAGGEAADERAAS